MLIAVCFVVALVLFLLAAFWQPANARLIPVGLVFLTLALGAAEVLKTL